MSIPVNQLLLGDCLEVLRTLPDSSVDAVVTDPPAGIEFMGKDWDNPEKFGSTFTAHGYSDGGDRVAAPTQKLSLRNPNCRKCRKHIRGKDGCRCEVPDSDEDVSFVHLQRTRQRDGFVQFLTKVMQECYRVLKPGGHAIVWSLPRTSHWTATAIENVGFEVRDALHHAKDRTPDVVAFLASLTPEQLELLMRAEESSNVMAHLFGSGFPKSLNISKSLDKMAGAVRKVVKEGKGFDPDRHVVNQFNSISPSNVGVNTAAFKARIGEVTEPATEEAKKWDGWGTALKPAVEIWWLVRKPVEAKNTTSQVLATGTGALNIDGCRVPTSDNLNGGAYAKELTLRSDGWGGYARGGAGEYVQPTGRWPANLVLSHGPGCRRIGTVTVDAPTINRFVDGMKPFGGGVGHAYESVGGGKEEQPVYECEDSCPIRVIDQQSGVLTSGAVAPHHTKNSSTQPSRGGFEGDFGDHPLTGYGDSGGASRFFNTFEPDSDAPFLYSVKASRSDKNADLDEEGLTNIHPTVKSQALMRHFVRLVTPPQGIVLDPFSGSGSTLVAAVSEGFSFIGVERDPEYHRIASARISKALSRSMEEKAQREAFQAIEGLPQE